MNREVIVDAFKWLFIGLLICFASSYITTQIPRIWTLIYSKGYVTISIIAELVIAFILVLRVRKLSPITAKILYILYTALTGMSLSWILLLYTGNSITFVFLVTSIIFGIFAIIGKNTEIDLMKWSTYLFIALICIILLEIINIFVLSSTLSIITCIASIVLFTAYIAYDIKYALTMAENLGENAGIYCAFQLFLDFINIFLRLLELFGHSRD